MYADLLRYYRVDLRDLLTDDPGITPALVLGLINELPFGCRTVAILGAGEDTAGWDTNSYLLAAVVDAVREGTFTNVQVRTKKKLKPPGPLPRPGVVVDKPEPVNLFVQMAQQQLEKELS